MRLTSCKSSLPVTERGRAAADCRDDSGELTFSKRLGFLDSGTDVDNMMYHTGRAMDYIGIV